MHPIIPWNDPCVLYDLVLQVVWGSNRYFSHATATNKQTKICLHDDYYNLISVEVSHTLLFFTVVVMVEPKPIQHTHIHWHYFVFGKFHCKMVKKWLLFSVCTMWWEWTIPGYLVDLDDADDKIERKNQQKPMTKINGQIHTSYRYYTHRLLRIAVCEVHRRKNKGRGKRQQVNKLEIRCDYYVEW